MKNILICGSKGQLGHEIEKISKTFSFNYFFVDVEDLDITKKSMVSEYVESNKIDFIVNCAAYTAVDKAEEDYENAFLINVTGVQNLTEVAKKYNIPLINISTDYVFDGKNHKPYTENDTTNPQSAYGRTKLGGENAVLKYKKGINIRTSWLYSVFGNNFVKTIIKIATEKPQIEVVNDQIGCPTNAADLAYCCLKIADDIANKNVQNYGLYQYSNEGVCSWYDFAKAICNIKKIECNVVPVSSEKFPRPAKRPFYSVMSKEKIKTDFNLQIQHWFDSLKKMLEN